MKFLVLLIAGVLCTVAGHSQPQKRQAPAPDQDQTCNNVIRSQQCISGHDQAYANLYYQCGYSIYAIGSESSCRANALGQFCGTFDVYSLRNSIESTCSSTPCTAECRDLLVSIKNQFGCCASVINDTTSGLSGSSASVVFNYTLWSDCRVEPSREECGPSTITLMQSMPPATILSC